MLSARPLAISWTLICLNLNRETPSCFAGCCKVIRRENAVGAEVGLSNGRGSLAEFPIVATLRILPSRR